MHLSREPSRSSADSYSFLPRKMQAKAVPRKDFFTHLRSHAKSTSSVSSWILRSDVTSWAQASRTPKNASKGWWVTSPGLTRVTPTALLGSWGWRPLKDMMFLGTDFETHANRQGYFEEPTAKDFIARKAHTIALCKVQGTHWNVIKCEAHLGIV